MLAEEYATSVHIKSRVNRQSVQSAITSIQQRLKLYHRIPDNGLAIFSGDVINDEGKDKKMMIDFEPFRTINKSFYLCDNKFHIESLSLMLSDDTKFGFIVVDGNGCLFGTLQGNSRQVLQKFTVDLPKKHGKGGQSALRFARLRLEKRHNYVRKVSEMAAVLFIDQLTNKCNVTGIVLAGSADFKLDIYNSDLFDPRLHKAVINLVDVCYGMDPGFNQAIELSGDSLLNVKLVKEKKLLQLYFDAISQDRGTYCFMVEDTLKALEMGAVETLIVWENLLINRCTLRNVSTREVTTRHLTSEQLSLPEQLFDCETGVQLEVVEIILLVEWLTENFKQFGAKIELVTDNSQEGSQFCQGFGGIGALLRWKIELYDAEVIDDALIEDANKDWDDADDFI